MSRRRQAVTVWDVAEAAQVSAQTVSRVLNGRGHATQETQRKVLEAATSLGYEPNVIGKSLRLTRTPMVGLVVADVTNPFYARLYRALEQDLRSSGLTVFLLSSEDDPEIESQQLALLRMYRPTGLILCPAVESRFDQREASRFENVVLVSRTLPDVSISTVQTNEADLFSAAADELFKNGHSRIAAILGPPTVSTTQLRESGLREALKTHPMTSADIRYTDGTGAAGRDAVVELLNDAHGATGIIGFNGPITAGILEAVHSQGLSCPDDLSVIGFTDAQWMLASSPSITAIAQPVEELGRCAGKLIKRVLDPTATLDVTHVTVPGRLVRRGSVTHPRGSSR